MLGTPKADEVVREKMRRVIDRQSAQLVRIVDDLLDVNRITRGTITMASEPCDVRDIVERALETVRPAIEGSKQSLSVELPLEPLKVRGDPSRLLQALTNVLSNATRYTDAGGSIFVTVSRVTLGDHSTVRISVRDTGRGIEPASAAIHFRHVRAGAGPAESSRRGPRRRTGACEIDHRAPSRDDRSRQRRAGKRSAVRRFHSRVARRPNRRVACLVHCSAHRRRHQRAAPALSRMRILVVDDNVDSADLLASLLRAHGHEVIVVNNGQDAIHVFEGISAAGHSAGHRHARDERPGSGPTTPQPAPHAAPDHSCHHGMEHGGRCRAHEGCGLRLSSCKACQRIATDRGASGSSRMNRLVSAGKLQDYHTDCAVSTDPRKASIELSWQLAISPSHAHNRRTSEHVQRR